MSLPAWSAHGKRPRACEACRRLKVQCTFSSSEIPHCERCIKANRQCVLTERKKRARIGHNVLALERKVASLLRDMDEIRGIGMQTEGQNTDSSLLPSPENIQESSCSSQGVGQTPDQGGSAGLTQVHGDNSHATMMQHQPSPVPNRIFAEWPEVVRRGAISKEQACKAYDHFVASMLPKFPVIAFERSITALQLQQSRPVLFLAVLSAGSGLFPALVQHALQDELSKTFAERILVGGSKSLELIQALQVGSIWLSAPRRFKDLKHYQLVSPLRPS